MCIVCVISRNNVYTCCPFPPVPAQVCSIFPAGKHAHCLILCLHFALWLHVHTHVCGRARLRLIIATGSIIACVQNSSGISVSASLTTYIFHLCATCITDRCWADNYMYVDAYLHVLTACVKGVSVQIFGIQLICFRAEHWYTRSFQDHHLQAFRPTNAAVECQTCYHARIESSFAFLWNQ